MDNENSFGKIKEKIDNDGFSKVFALSGILGVGLGFLWLWLDIIFGLAVMIAGLFSFKKYKVEKNKEENYVQYISLILTHKENSIPKIADEMGVSYEEALKKITEIISKNYLVCYKINKKEKTVVKDEEYFNNTNVQQINSINGDVDVLSKSARATKCPNCGGTIFIEQDGCKYCKYCGRKI